MTQESRSRADTQLGATNEMLSPVVATSPGASGLRCIRLEDRYRALGLAANMLSKVKPYSDYSTGALVPTLMAEIMRGHYAFTLGSESVLGYAGWALCLPEVAQKWVTGHYIPSFDECLQGSCPVLLTFHSKDPSVTRFQIRFLRTLYPGQSVYFRRDYADGRTRSAKVVNSKTVAHQSI